MDRNYRKGCAASAAGMSLSARRAWIEMVMRGSPAMRGSVALRKESVDRNFLVAHRADVHIRRSPQGERG